MTLFIACAAALVLATLFILLGPLLLRGAAGAAPTAAFRQGQRLRGELARIDHEHAQGTLDGAAYDRARRELERQALQALAVAGDPPAPRFSRATLVALALLLPVLGAVGYVAWGVPLAVIAPGGAGTGMAVAEGPAPAGSPAAADPQVERMVAQLAEKLQKDPSDKKGWVLLGRSYKVLGRLAEAENAYERAGDAMDGNAAELANYADVAATNAKGSFAGKPVALIEKALKADPQNTMALWLAGTAALNLGDAAGAVKVWQKLLTLLPPDSDDAREIRSAIATASARAAGK